MCGALLLATALASATRAEEISPIEWRPSAAAWDPVGVHRHGLSLQVAYRRNCFERNRHVTVKETRTRVTVTIHDEDAVFAPGRFISCPPPKQVALVLRLAHPLAGRSIGGPALASEPRGAFAYVGSESEPVEVPRLIGFAPKDAELALDFGYLGARVLRTRASAGLARVIGQEPAPGHMMRRHGVVRLLVAR